jgi:hypothetical protein
MLFILNFNYEDSYNDYVMVTQSLFSGKKIKILN